MKKILIILLLFFCILDYAQAQDILETAYKKKSKIMLNDFFRNWQEEIKPIGKDELLSLSDTIQNTYKVFSAFYKPLDLISVGNSEWGDSIYQNVKTLIVQNSVKIYFVDKVYYTEEETDSIVTCFIKKSATSEKVIDRRRINLYLEASGSINDMLGYKEVLTDSIMDFRPNVNSQSKRITYLVPKYNVALNNFLGNSYWKVKGKLYFSPNRGRREVEKRKAFLEDEVKIWDGHWGGYWQLLSYPQAYSVVFDKDMEYAKVYFRLVYQGGEAYLKKENGNWTVLSSRLTWIE
ncbi:hypothetical protein D0T84_05930 [Dysgonomonas sp. 521]|uniref:hypothetical protein n=1 Tax=Dysgonomonas sp. 521 TaxID=2302932 RepID=UPI0013D2D87D|nr:hypothetical protein [Dysgonomonas sp. 521]NDV94460.1 hypothetical protein [Dysgonomonas sp. 521]